MLPGVELEPKALTTTIHFRHAEESTLEQLAAIVLSLVPDDHPDLEVVQGRLNYEIRPRLDWNKASAIQWIQERTRVRDALPIIIGDARTDRNVSTTIEGAITIHVGPKEGTAAEYYLEHQEDVEKWLSWLLGVWKERLEGPARTWAPRSDAPRPPCASPPASSTFDSAAPRSVGGRQRACKDYQVLQGAL